MPDLAPEVQNLVRFAYGCLLLGTLVYTLPQARRFFVAERWRGYAISSWDVNLLHNPVAMVAVQMSWLAIAGLLITGWWSPWVALANLLLCRYFFIHMRWKGVLRGMGAPGFTTYWLGLVVFMLEFTATYAPYLRTTVLLVAQADFAFLYLSSGIYKFKAGYLQGEGMELGMVNPQWGYWWRSLKNLRPANPLFTISNQAAWSLEIVAVILMLVPATRFWGGMLLMISFVYVAAFIRLGLLAEMVMLTGVLYFDVGSLGDGLLRPVGALVPGSTAPAVPIPPALFGGLEVLLWVYLAFLPIAYAGLHYNFYARARLPESLQTMLERYTNSFGIIIWRVFSVDLINFCIRIYHLTDNGPKEITRYGWRSGGVRFSHVGESITLTCLFTTLKYYPNDPNIFRDRLLRYARTLPVPENAAVRFQYLRIVKHPDRFELRPVAEFDVDLRRSTIHEQPLDEAFSLRAPAAVSPVHVGAKPGSYAPASS